MPSKERQAAVEVCEVRAALRHYPFAQTYAMLQSSTFMFLRRGLGILAGFALSALGCKERVPDDHTSLVEAPGADPGKLSKRLSMVWLHHSTGDSLLNGGLLGALKQDGLSFYDINYDEAVVDGYVVGDHTDIPDWPKTFTTPKYFDVVKSWELPAGSKHHDIVMFKSCFPNSNIKSDEMLAQYKQYYSDLLPTVRANPDILFIAMSTPPLVEAKTTPDAARRARAFSRWLRDEYAPGQKNLKIFDLFDALAIREDKPKANTLVPQFAKGDKDSHPTDEGARAVTRLFIPWLNRSVRDAGLLN